MCVHVCARVCNEFTSDSQHLETYTGHQRESQSHHEDPTGVPRTTASRHPRKRHGREGGSNWCQATSNVWKYYISMQSFKPLPLKIAMTHKSHSTYAIITSTSNSFK